MGELETLPLSALGLLLDAARRAHALKEGLSNPYVRIPPARLDEHGTYWSIAVIGDGDTIALEGHYHQLTWERNLHLANKLRNEIGHYEAEESIAIKRAAQTIDMVQRAQFEKAAEIAGARLADLKPRYDEAHRIAQSPQKFYREFPSSMAGYRFTISEDHATT